MTAYSFNLSDFVLIWWGILYEAMPFVILGTLLSGVVERCVSRETVVRFFPKNRILGIGVSACMGLVFPMCECGVVPIVRRLILKGVPSSCGVAYMLASPIVNPLVILSTMVAFRGKDSWTESLTVTGLRVAMGYFVAVVVGIVVWKLLGEGNVLLGASGKMNEKDGKAAKHAHTSVGVAPESENVGMAPENVDMAPESVGMAPDGRVPGRRGNVVVDVLVHAAGDFMVIGATLVVGAGLAALINSGFSRSAMEPFATNPFTAVAGMSALAVGLNLCSEADAFVARSFVVFPLAAKLAFLVLGPMVDLKLIAIYTTVFRPKAIVAIIGLTTVLVFLLCVTGYLWIPMITPATVE